jgi:hypothetical protein
LSGFAGRSSSLPPGHSAGALTREAALALLEEVVIDRDDACRYRALIARLRALVDEFPE